MQELRDDILERTKQMISLCHSANANADQTMMTLADQHEQLVDIQTHLISIDTAVADTRKNVDRLKGITQRVIGSVRTKFYTKIFSKLNAHSKEKSCSSARRRPLPLKPVQPNIPASNSGADPPIDNALYEISHLINTLKDKAYTINGQLVADVVLIGKLRESMGESTDHIQEQDLEMKKLS